ncbi:hypothetical protein D8674_028533 [Pyrus ussuriensis x Pyrus communis]|uniref:Uncharacterized protein n=1 Tax=Pyrus ussuriensis x Pyrus communis TaxID=2448454 RepID=A0A5N5HWI3_9ROSA|nr:hypothetical protein D8674_028533 [Pyrus ussuriensis x Pyrus communis]
MSSSSHKSDDGVPSLYSQGGSLSKVGYFKAAHFKISLDDLFKDFLDAYRHAIPSGMHVKHVKEGNSYLEFGLTPKTSPYMKKVYVALGIPSEYRECHWLLSLLRQEKDRLLLRDEVNRIKAEALACPITVVEPTTNEGGKKRFSPPTQEMPAEKKLKISSAAREGSPAALRLVINLTSSKGEKDEATGFVPIADRIAQRKSSTVPPVLKFVQKRLSRVKPGSPLERLATMKSNKVNSYTKMLGYVDYLLPFGFKFAGKDFKTFSISSEDLFAFTFEASIGEVVEEVGAQAGAAGGVPLLFNLFIVHGGEGVATFVAYSVDLVWTFPDRIHLFGTFSSGEGFLEAIEDCLVGCFGMPIALRIPRRGHVLFDAIFLDELHQIFAYELHTIVCDDGLRDAKSINDVPSYEMLYLRLNCCCHGLCFYPFGEVISCYDHHAFAPNSVRHQPYQFDCPLHERPRTRLRV